MENEIAHKYGKIFNIKITSSSLDRVLRFISARLIDKEKFYIVTPNPEIVLKAKHDKVLAKSIENSDWAIPDGRGLYFAAKFLDGTKLEIIPGRVLFLELIKLFNKKGLNVVFFGSRNDTVTKAKEEIEQNYKNIKILALNAPEYDRRGLPLTPDDRLKQKSATARMKMFEPDFIFVGISPPKQEKWILKNFFYLPGIGAMTVGGTFDYIAGIKQLPPKWMEKLGLEWLYRLIQEPSRFRRIWNSVVVFSWEVFKYKYIDNYGKKDTRKLRHS